nr:DUF3108 domain-containing protein [Moraxella sp. CTOTU49097]
MKNSLVKKLLVSTSLVSAMAITSMANAAVAPFNATYNFNIEGKYNGTASRVLTQTGNQYFYNVNASVGKLASAKQTANFVNANGAILPVSALTQYKILGTGRTTTLNFNNAKKQLVTNYKGQNKVIALPQSAYDDLSLEIQIREDLKAGKFRGNYYMADRNTVEAVPFKKSAMTRITVPAGTFDVVRIDRVHDDKDRRTSFWLAPKLDYLPVKVVQNNDGKKMEMNLARVN